MALHLSTITVEQARRGVADPRWSVRRSRYGSAMANTRAEAAYIRSAAAFKDPTVGLLHGTFAPFVVAMLSIVFTADRPTVAVADAHAEIGEALEELRAAGYDEGERRLPTGTAREICRGWVRVGWLATQIDDDVESYRLTAHAVGALEITDRSGASRARVSRSRVRTLLEAVEHLAREAQADPEQRKAMLLEQRAAIDAEIARLQDGQERPIDAEQLFEEAENILHLTRELPADFARVAESLKQMQRDVVADLRRDVRPTGEILREYLQRGNEVMQSTREGRAFEGALQLIGDPEQIDRLTDQIAGLLSQPFAELMAHSQRADLRAIARVVEQGVDDVLTAQRRASQVITSQVRTHDPVRDRQIDGLLRSVMSGLHEWMQNAKPGDRIEPLRTFPTAAVGVFRQTVSDLKPPGVPAPLHTPADAPIIEADTRAWGGPNYAELESYVAGLGDKFDLAEAFAGAAAETRRPVDLLGLLEIAHRHDMSESGEVSVTEAVRPDGSSRRFAFGSVTVTTNKESDVD
jgi:hypothetical protein